jgi:hypothetical protein
VYVYERFRLDLELTANPVWRGDVAVSTAAMLSDIRVSQQTFVALPQSVRNRITATVQHGEAVAFVTNGLS